MKLTRKKSRLHLIVILLAAVNVLLLAGLVLLFTSEKSPEEQRRRELIEMIGPEAENMSDEQLDDARLELLSDQIIRVSYNPEPHLEDGGINIFLSNGTENGFSVSMELKNLESGEIIASTGLIDPGYRLETLQCEAGLAPGQYHCLMVLKAFSRDDVYLGEAGRHLMLSVK